MIKLFIKIFGAIVGVGGAIGIIIGAYAWGESLRPASITKDDVKDIVNQELIIVRKQNDLVIQKVDNLNKKVESVDKTVGVVKNQLGNHIIKTSNDKQDILDWFSAIEEKKDSMSFLNQ